MTPEQLRTLKLEYQLKYSNIILDHAINLLKQYHVSDNLFSNKINTIEFEEAWIIYDHNAKKYLYLGLSDVRIYIFAESDELIINFDDISSKFNTVSQELLLLYYKVLIDLRYNVITKQNVTNNLIPVEDMIKKDKPQIQIQQKQKEPVKYGPARIIRMPLRKQNNPMLDNESQSTALTVLTFIHDFLRGYTKRS
jgi:hypothetical protein